MRFDFIVVSIVSQLLLQTWAVPIKFPAHGRGTFFKPGYYNFGMVLRLMMLNRLGACGGTDNSKNMIVALGIGLFNSKPDGGNPNNNPFCGNKVRVQHGLPPPMRLWLIVRRGQERWSHCCRCMWKVWRCRSRFESRRILAACGSISGRNSDHLAFRRLKR